MAVATIQEFKEYFLDKLEKTGSLDEAFTKATWTAFRIGYNMGIDDGLMGNGVKFNFERATGQRFNKKT